ncbi:TonB-dependent receptor plug domain-containing protein [Neolewinella agarilytica]|uniref:Outer membrane receptor proteins, mostly Fe transport n=1 Tax=Neolewinella agarilytica TaxID=478744 RepID=A0A1H9I6H7_9BACT|nr:TonB-dependent receptor plug domain-containing protein [Neolewinella agarilytica]SEQ70174.1 Outer membrane receptor proteins, mostly Fe transport [Neolewinella agarilytica]
MIFKSSKIRQGKSHIQFSIAKLGVAFLLLCPLVLGSQSLSKSTTLTVLDAISQEPITNVYLLDDQRLTVGLSDEEGIIRFSTKNSAYWITSHLSYLADTIYLQNLIQDETILLHPAENSLSTISVTAQPSNDGSVVSLNEKQIRSVPALLGEADPLRAALRIAGVESGGELNSRLHVRGGLPGENLTLLDGVPIYNETHVGPLFSIFNTDVLQNFTVHKIAAPAEKGSGISALLDAKTKLPDFNVPQLSFGIGPINSSVYYNGPWMNSKRTAVAIGLRGSPLSLLSLFSKKENLTNATLIELGDINLALRHEINPRSTIWARAFWTHDLGLFAQQSSFSNNPEIVDIRERNTVRWNNRGYSIKWDYTKGTKWTNTAQLYGAMYSYQIAETSESRNSSGITIDSSQFSLKGFVEDFGLRLLTKRYYSFGQLKFGTNLKQLKSLPVVLEEEVFNEFILSSTRKAYIANLFFNLLYNSNGKTELTFSAKLNNFWSEGYNIHLPTGFFSIQQNINSGTSVKFTAERIAQFAHALPSFGGAWELNSWLLASEAAPAAVANRAEISLQYPLSERISIVQALYLRYASNLVRASTANLADLFTGAQFTPDRCCATDGKAKNYGLETSLNYSNNSNLIIGINYTLARSVNEFPRINAGQPFSPRFDRRHSLSFWLSKSLKNNRWTVNAQFIYQSGLAYTVPIARVPSTTGIGLIPIYDQVNNTRFPAAHRMDMGVDYKWNGKNSHKNTLSAGVYNLYNQVNPINFSLRSRRNPPRDGLFPNPVLDTQVFSEGVFGFFPYVSFKKNFSLKRKQ